MRGRLLEAQQLWNATSSGSRLLGSYQQGRKNLATALLSLQSAAIRDLFSGGLPVLQVSLDQLGESTEPIRRRLTLMCRQIEIDLRDTLGEKDVPSLEPARNNIIL